MLQPHNSDPSLGISSKELPDVGRRYISSSSRVSFISGGDKELDSTLWSLHWVHDLIRLWSRLGLPRFKISSSPEAASDAAVFKPVAGRLVWDTSKANSGLKGPLPETNSLVEDRIILSPPTGPGRESFGVGIRWLTSPEIAIASKVGFADTLRGDNLCITLSSPSRMPRISALMYWNSLPPEHQLHVDLMRRCQRTHSKSSRLLFWGRAR